MKRLYRSRRHSVIGGVCGGIAEYFTIDPTIVRLAWILAIFLGGAGVVAYVIAWIIIPVHPEQEWDDDWHWSSRVRGDTDSGGEPSKSAEGPRAFGLILVAVGVYLLARNFLPHLGLGRFWPVLLVALGLYLVYSAMRSDG